jgi:hypothetical protein
VPSPAPFEAEALLRTEHVILRHYAIFLVALLPVLVSCSRSQSSSVRRQSGGSAIVTRIL